MLRGDGDLKANFNKERVLTSFEEGLNGDTSMKVSVRRIDVKQ